MHVRAVAICQRAVRRKQDTRRFDRLSQETAALRLQVAQMEQMSEASASLQAQLVAQDEGFQVEMREMQKSLVEAERALAVKQQHEDAAQQLQAQSTAELLSMQEDLLAQAEALIADKQQLEQREAAVAKREVKVSPAFGEIDSMSEALANERADRAKDRVARQRLEEQLRKHVAREAGLTKQAEALQRRVQEQQKLLVRMQAKSAGSEAVQQPAAGNARPDDRQKTELDAQQSPSRPRRGSPQKLQASPDSVSEALANERADRAKDRVARQRLEEQLRKHAAREAGLTKQAEALQRRVQEQQKLLVRMQAKSAGSGTVQQPAAGAADAQRSPNRPRRDSPQKLQASPDGSAQATQNKSAASDAVDQSPGSWFGPYRPHEPRSPLSVEERKAQGKAMLWSHGKAAVRAAPTASGGADPSQSGAWVGPYRTASGAAEQSQSGPWFGPHRPHEPRSPLPAEERKAQGKAMLWSHGTAAARAAAAAGAKDKPSGTREEIRSLSSMLEAQAVQAQTEAESDRLAAEAASAERAAAAEEAARDAGVALLQQGVRLDMFFATGKLKHGRFFWLAAPTEQKGATSLSWGKAAHAAPRSSKTEILRSVTDGPSLSLSASVCFCLSRRASVSASASACLFMSVSVSASVSA